MWSRAVLLCLLGTLCAVQTAPLGLKYIPPPGVPILDCSQRRNGIYPAEGVQCVVGFFMCSEHREYWHPCPIGPRGFLAFDAQSQSCVWPAAVAGCH